MKIVNLIPHAITWRANTGEELTFPVSDSIARVATKQVEREALPIGIPTVSQKFGEVEGLPEQKEGTYYIVSSIVAAALNGARNDILIPDTGKTCVRDENGRIVAVRQFIR